MFQLHLYFVMDAFLLAPRAANQRSWEAAESPVREEILPVRGGSKRRIQFRSPGQGLFRRGGKYATSGRREPSAASSYFAQANEGGVKRGYARAGLGPSDGDRAQPPGGRPFPGVCSGGHGGGGAHLAVTGRGRGGRRRLTASGLRGVPPNAPEAGSRPYGPLPRAYGPARSPFPSAHDIRFRPPATYASVRRRRIRSRPPATHALPSSPPLPSPLSLARLSALSRERLSPRSRTLERPRPV